MGRSVPLEPAIINADWTKNMMYPGYSPCNSTKTRLEGRKLHRRRGLIKKKKAKENNNPCLYLR